MKILIDFFDVLSTVFYSVSFYLLKFLLPGVILYFMICSFTKKQIKKELDKYDLKKKEQLEEAEDKGR
ncbi:MAG: hypothetical protein AB9836_01925 [Aminipila sp.]